MISMCSPSVHTTPVDVQDAEQRLNHLPPLEELFLHWYLDSGNREGSSATVHASLLQREQELGPMTLSAASLQLLYKKATRCLAQYAATHQQNAWKSRPLHDRIIRHAASLTALQKQAYMPTGVVVQKTVTVMLGETCILCTGAGTYQLARGQLRHIARTLALSSNAASYAIINPASVNPVERYGMQPGMVSSFLPPGRTTGLAAIVLLPLPSACIEQENHEPTQEVAISLSLWESLLLPLHCFHPLVADYCSHACPTIPCIS